MTSSTTPTQVQVQLQARLGEHVLPVDLAFNPRDPYAVTLALSSGASRVEWTFSRDLLVAGRFEPVGQGDVEVWPSLDREGNAVLVIELHTQGRSAFLQTSARGVHQFVEAMLASVPVGDESDHVDMDLLLSELLDDAHDDLFDEAYDEVSEQSTQE